MAKEIKISHELIQDPQTITQVNREVFRSHGLDPSIHEVEKITDDMKNGMRHILVKTTKYFTVPELPWKRVHAA